MLEIPHEDLVRDLKGTVVMYSNRPVFVEDIARDGNVRLLDLLSQRKEIVPFSMRTFCSPTRRLGFVNSGGSAVYAYRTPVRKYNMGICSRNIKVNALAAHYPQGKMDTKDRVARLTCPEVGDALLNKYPSISEAGKQLKSFRGVVAFDKQFALSSDQEVFYKTDVVGYCSLDAKGVQDIKWNDGKEYLSLLLDNNHEKAIRNFRPSAG